MPTNAVLRMNAGDLAPRLVRNAGVMEGTRWYDIDLAPSIDDTYSANGLPADGAAWSPAYPLLKARGFDPSLKPGPNGCYLMRVDYREDTATSFTAEDGFVTTTAIENASTSETVDYDINGTKKLTNDGRGVPKLLSTTAFEILTYHGSLPNLAVLQHLRDEPKINDAPVTLKNILNSGTNFVIAAGELLYSNYIPGRDQGLFVIRHQLQWRRDWKNYRPITDAKGTQLLDNNGKGRFEAADQYESASFGGVLG